ncbi:MAG TPA: hypothetical protein VNZ49_15325 [Bacteroidia bacterium]|jgi:hypothetical protein|nr:hypothetical protein [Bacteroidia bacterium]
MRINKLAATFLFVTICLATLAQKDSISLFQFEKLNTNDKLIIDYKNIGCRVNSGDRLVFYTVDKGIKFMRFENFHQKLTVDGFALDNYEKQKFKTENNDYKSQIITVERFHFIMKELEGIINSENKDALKYAGDNSELTLQLNNFNLTRQFKGWIELKNLPKVSQSRITDSTNSVDENKLNSFLKELRVNSSANSLLYNKYIFINDPGKPDRSTDDKIYYTDTLFSEISNLVRRNNFTVYSLVKARKKFKKENLYNYYYDGQKDAIYVIAIKTDKRFEFYYSLMYLGKIVSLMPSKILENEIIGWR